jgi:hypothetical protein
VRVAYVGNFGPSHSTESHVGTALEADGLDLVRHQEDEVDWDRLAAEVADADFVLWTHTEGLAGPQTYDAQRRFLDSVEVPTAVLHLDLWHGLGREHLVRESPHFRCDVVCTADGGHDDAWKAAGVNHHWLPPGVSEAECVPGTPRDEYRSELAFVGSWQGGYHRESKHRFELVRFLQKRYGNRCKFWPRKHEPAVRGDALRDLYASVDLAVGDSCMAGSIDRYWSDRVPETVGRGACLLHPAVPGLEEHFKHGEHLLTYTPFDFADLGCLIDYYLDHPDERRTIAAAGREHVLATATYEVRVEQLIDLLRAERLL